MHCFGSGSKSQAEAGQFKTDQSSPEVGQGQDKALWSDPHPLRPGVGVHRLLAFGLGGVIHMPEPCFGFQSRLDQVRIRLIQNLQTDLQNGLVVTCTALIFMLPLRVEPSQSFSLPQTSTNWC